jgi:hypothetical protein
LATEALRRGSSSAERPATQAVDHSRIGTMHEPFDRLVRFVHRPESGCVRRYAAPAELTALQSLRDLCGFCVDGIGVFSVTP